MDGLGIVLVGLVMVAGTVLALNLLVRDAPAEPPSTLPLSAEPVSLAQRTQRLQAEIAYWAARGFRVTTQTDTTAQLLKPKSFSLGWALLWLLVILIGFVVYLLYYLSKQDETLYLSVDEYGRVARHGTAAAGA